MHCHRNPDADLVFPSPRGGVLTDMFLTTFLRIRRPKAATTGVSSENGYPRDLPERALTISNQAEAADHRTDLLEQRRPMMEAWAQHVGGFAVACGVTPMRGCARFKACGRRSSGRDHTFNMPLHRVSAGVTGLRGLR